MLDSQWSPCIEDLVSLWISKQWFCYIYSEYRQYLHSQVATHFLLVAVSIVKVMESWVAARDRGYTAFRRTTIQTFKNSTLRAFKQYHYCHKKWLNDALLTTI